MPNSAQKFGYAPPQSPKPVQNAVNQPHQVTEYETCMNAVTSRKPGDRPDVENSVAIDVDSGTERGEGTSSDKD